MVHYKCRAKLYPFGNIQRFLFPDNQVPWDVKFDYNPPEYNAPLLQNKPWADPNISEAKFQPKWNSLDGKINRVSHTGNYLIVNNRPLNPEGRTGLCGRGVLGRWGPNHAADPIVTRWKIINDQKQLHSKTNLPILQFCAIQRKDCNQWALPGGMVDPGEIVSETLRREFLEEALSALDNKPEQAHLDELAITNFFQNGVEIYKGYVDDPRNTDNSWMETVAVNFHDETGKSVGKFSLKAGDDAKNVKWMDIDSNLDLYASHSSLLQTVTQLKQAHW